MFSGEQFIVNRCITCTNLSVNCVISSLTYGCIHSGNVLLPYLQLEKIGFSSEAMLEVIENCPCSCELECG